MISAVKGLFKVLHQGHRGIGDRLAVIPVIDIGVVIDEPDSFFEGGFEFLHPADHLFEDFKGVIVDGRHCGHVDGVLDEAAARGGGHINSPVQKWVGAEAPLRLRAEKFINHFGGWLSVEALFAEHMVASFFDFAALRFDRAGNTALAAMVAPNGVGGAKMIFASAAAADDSGHLHISSSNHQHSHTGIMP